MRNGVRLWTTALLVATFAGAAHAAIRASGFHVDQTGPTVLVASPDGRGFHLSGIDASGTCGVTMPLTGLQGQTVVPATPWDGSDAGSQVSFRWSVVSKPQGSSAQLSMTRLATVTHVTLSNPFTTSPTMTCALYGSDGTLLTHFDCPTDFSFDLSSPPGVATPIPTVSFQVVPQSLRVVWTVDVAAPTVFVSGGVDMEQTRVELSSQFEDGDIPDQSDLRVTAPAGSHLSSLDVASMSSVSHGVQMATADFDVDGSPDTKLHVSVSPLYQQGSLEMTNPAYEQAFDRATGALLSHLDVSSPPLALQLSRTSPFVIDPATDEGLSLECGTRVVQGCNPEQVAKLTLQVVSHVLQVSSRFDAICADQESVYVEDHGHIVMRQVVALDGTVSVSAPPGGSPSTGVDATGVPVTRSTSNIQNNLKVGQASSSSVVASDGLDLSVAFLQQRRFCVDGVCADGDNLIFHGACSSGSCGAITVVGSNFSLQRAASGGGGSALDILDITRSGVDQVSAVVAATSAITGKTPVERIDIDMERIDHTPSRGASVTFALSSNLVLAPAGVSEGSYFSSAGQTQMFVVDNGLSSTGHSYTVDLALLGPGCGPTTDGRLFSVPVARAPGAPDGVGGVTILATELADCNAQDLPMSPGASAIVVLDGTPPAPVSLTATPVTSGNDHDGTIRIALSWTQPEPLASVQVYRAAYGNYPDYDDGPAAGSDPPPLVLPQTGRWTPVTLSCSSSSAGLASTCTDETSTRDSYTFTVVVRDTYGNESVPSSPTPQLTNYEKGDVADGGPVSCSGDNLVDTRDISALGAHYGAPVPVGSPFECLDFGPTVDHTLYGRPLTDHKLSFADLILAAIDFSSVSRPQAGAQPAPAPANELRLSVPSLPAVGESFDVGVRLAGAGDALGVSTQLAWDPAVVEPLGVSEGGLIARQGRAGVVLSSEPGDVDAALLGVGPGLAGEGELARVTFRVKAAGEAGIGIAAVDARDAQNRSLAIGFAPAPGAGPGPARTALRLAFPNPFVHSTTVVFALQRTGPASVRVYDVAGRNVRTLVSGVQPAGERVIAWDGRDDGGAPLSAGVYMLRLEAGGHQESRAVRLVK